MVSRAKEEGWLEEDWPEGLMGKGHGGSRDGREAKCSGERRTEGKECRLKTGMKK